MALYRVCRGYLEGEGSCLEGVRRLSGSEGMLYGVCGKVVWWMWVGCLVGEGRLYGHCRDDVWSLLRGCLVGLGRLSGG